VRIAAWVLALALTGAGTVHAQAGYLDQEALTRALRSITNGSDLATLRSLGKSTEGRDIWLVEIGRRSGAALDTRPGLLVVGNLEGDHLAGSAMAVEAIRHLLSAEGRAAAADVLANNVIYVVPRLNPDGAQAMFARVRTGQRTNARPVDDDNDGRIDEDPGEDLNGDGMITLMRVPDPAGDYLVDAGDARLMRRADRSKGEAGAFRVYREGRDTDHDGFYNEDGPGGVDLNRNFQHAYPYWNADAGPWMVSEPESRALMDFTIAHRNIAAILTFGLSDNLVVPPNDRGVLANAAVLTMGTFADAANREALTRGVFRVAGGGGGFGGRGPGGGGGGGGGPPLRGAQAGRDNDSASGQRPNTTVHRNDRGYYTRVSALYRELTGITKVGVNREAEGAFFQYGYFQFGVPSFSTPGWGHARAAKDSSLDVTMLAVLDSAHVAAFVNWTPFTHPELGAVEIGGFDPYAVINPPADSLAALGAKHGAFIARLAGLLPRVRIAATEVTNHGGGVFTVKVTVENAGYFPTALQQGVAARAVAATTVQIQVPPEAVLTGANKTHRIARLEGSGAREEVSWVIRGRQGSTVEIRVRAQKGGTATSTVTLR
jgi:hypothetical protein